jgi:hypothetical protein
MLLYHEEGERSAATLLSARGRDEDPQLRDLMQALLRAIPRERALNGEFLIPEAGMLEELRLTLFPELDAPLVTAPAVQLELVPTSEEEAEVGAEA